MIWRCSGLAVSKPTRSSLTAHSQKSSTECDALASRLWVFRTDEIADDADVRRDDAPSRRTLFGIGVAAILVFGLFPLLSIQLSTQAHATHEGWSGA
jgi:hypothetical protein